NPSNSSFPVEEPSGQSFPNPPQDPPLNPRAREQSHYGGVNHINIFEMEQFIQAIRDGKPAPTGAVAAASETAPKPVEPAPPDVITYPDGDYKTLWAKLKGLKASDGGQPVIQLNHPRFKADFDTRLPPAERGRDYGIKSFGSIDKWSDAMNAGLPNSSYLAS